ncbi:MAG TPA: hypothetical protein VL947_07455 [Cytophagales bacterium]|nr:hypothetical protein [Cytophagales bacterium]
MRSNLPNSAPETIETFSDEFFSKLERDMKTIENKLKEGFLDKDLLLLYRELREQRDQLLVHKV